MKKVKSILLFLSIIILILIVIIAFLPKKLCIPDGWQCKQYWATQNKMYEIAMLLKIFQEQTGYFPKTLVVLQETSELNNKMHKINIVDSWGNIFIYMAKIDKVNFILYSAGRNGKDEFGKGDDITFNTKLNIQIYCE